MKKIILLFIAGLLAFSCNLDKYPFSEVAADDYVKGEESVNNLVIGMYNGLHSVMYYEWAVGEVRSDNARLRANNSTSQDSKLIEELDNNTISTTHSWVQSYWDACYSTINRANGVFPYLELVDDAQKRAQFEGEARFIRAYLYFNLVRLWGPVFKVTRKTGSDEARYMQRSTVDEIYELIENDLNTVIEQEMLPVTMPAADLGRADLKAAKALLAKVYMTHYRLGDSQYEAAKGLLEDVIAACGNPQSAAELVPYDKIWAKDNEMNPEIIFAVRYKEGNLGIGSPFSTLFGPVNNGGNVVLGAPKQYNYPSDDLINLYDANDRRASVVYQAGYTDKVTGSYVSVRWCNKYMQNDMAAEYDAEIDWPVIRLADVMLLYAEIMNETAGVNDESVLYLNMIRQRAGAAAYTPAELSSKYALREALRKERRMELALENQRWFDLQRWGIVSETINAYYRTEAFYSAYNYTVNPIQDWQGLLPVPQTVLDVNDRIAQNPGY